MAARQFKVGNTTIPYPINGFKVNLEDISDEETGRSLSGLMSKKIVAQKRTIQCTWKNLSDNLSSQLLQAIKGNSLVDAQGKTYVSLTYPDPILGTDTTKTFYTGTPSSELSVCVNDICYWNINMDFIEQ